MKVSLRTLLDDLAKLARDLKAEVRVKVFLARRSQLALQGGLETSKAISKSVDNVAIVTDDDDDDK
jgi:hypothetical protein